MNNFYMSKNKVLALSPFNLLIFLSLAPAIFLSSTQRCGAIGFQIPNQDAAAIARGNAFAATADNPSAIYYNPAGINQIQGTEVEVGVLNYLGLNVHHESTSGTSTDTKFEVIPVPQVYAVMSPTNMPVAFGVGLYAPFGLGVKWPEDSGFRSIAIESRLQFITLSPVASWQICPGLSLAAGPTVNYAEIKLSRGLFTSSDEFDFKGDDIALGGTAGLLWQPCSEWSFGIDYRSPVTMNFGGHASYTGSGTTHTTAEIPFPQTLSGGISYRPTEKWNIEADVEWINWDAVNTVTFKGTPLGNLPLPLDWHDSFQYKFGVTRYFDKGWFASAGYYFISDTTSSFYFTPAVPDTDLHVGSVGFGQKGIHWRWALAGQIIAGPKRTIVADSGNSNPFTGETAAGTYQLFIPTVSLSVGYHF